MSAPGYIIFTEEIHDAAQVAEYVGKAGATVGPFEGQPVVLGGQPQVLEGKWHGDNVVILRFKDVETARGWYNSPAYQKIVGLRLSATDSRSAILEGVEGADLSDCKVLLLITQVVQDADRLATYAAAAKPITASHNGVRVITSQNPDVIEGDWHGERIVMLGFKSADHVMDWYNDPAYQAIVNDRLEAADCRAAILPIFGA